MGELELLNAMRPSFLVTVWQWCFWVCLYCLCSVSLCNILCMSVYCVPHYYFVYVCVLCPSVIFCEQTWILGSIKFWKMLYIYQSRGYKFFICGKRQILKKNLFGFSFDKMLRLMVIVKDGKDRYTQTQTAFYSSIKVDTDEIKSLVYWQR